MTTPKFNQSTLTFDEYIRLNNITEDQILEASDTITEQEIIIEQQEKEIERLKEIINSFDFDTINAELDCIEQCCGDDTQSSLIVVTKILDNYKLRTRDI